MGKRGREGGECGGGAHFFLEISGSAVGVEGKKRIRRHEQLTWLTVYKNFAQDQAAEHKRKRAAGSDGEDQQED
jgi:hypothetical protein